VMRDVMYGIDWEVYLRQVWEIAHTSTCMVYV